MTVQTATRQEVQHKLRASVMQQDLDRALKAHAGSTSADKFLPILATIHIQTRADHLILTSTNLELAQMTRVPARSKWPDKASAVCVDYKTLKEYVALSEPARIDLDYVPEYRSLVASPLEHAKPHLRVRCARDQAHLKARPASDFPAVPKAAPDGVLEKITLKEFKARVKPIGSVKKRSGTFEAGGRTFTLNLGALYRAWQNLSSYEKGTDYPVFIGSVPETGVLWIICHNYAAFIITSS